MLQNYNDSRSPWPTIFEWTFISFFALLVSTEVKNPWIDEFAGIAFSAFPDLSSMLTAIYNTFPTVNHGQTGLYFILQGISIKAFGAELWAFRWPSYLSYGLALICISGGLRILGVSLWIRVLCLMYLANVNIIQVHASDGRPYMPLAATVLLFLYIWALRAKGILSEKNSYYWIFASMCIGFLFHPYFVMYLGLMVILMPLCSDLFRADIWRSLRPEIRTRTAILVFLSLLVFAAIAYFTWTRGMKSLNFDPYRWLGRDRHISRIMFGNILGPFHKLWAVAFLLFGGGIAWSVWKNRVLPSNTKIALALFAVLVLSQVVLFYSSVRANYWLLQRQWIAAPGIALFATGLIASDFFQLEFFRKLIKKIRIPNVELLVAGTMLGMLLMLQSPKLLANLSAELDPAYTPLELRAELCVEEFKPEAGMMLKLATHNFYEGGEIYPIFACYYDSDCDKDLTLAATRRRFCQ